MLDERYICRCSRGHLFSHSYRWWWYGGRFTILARLGFAGYTHCPVGNHWGLVRHVNERDLAQEELETLRLREDLDDRDGITAGLAIALFFGVGGLVTAAVDHSRWEAIAAATWTTVSVALFIRGRAFLRRS